MSPFRLTEGEKASTAWIRIAAQLEARLNTLRSRNDGDLDPIATAKVRGAIEEIKRTLAFARPEPPPPAPDPDDY